MSSAVTAEPRLTMAGCGKFVVVGRRLCKVSDPLAEVDGVPARAPHPSGSGTVFTPPTHGRSGAIREVEVVNGTARSSSS